jgi:hypothetical protein
LSQAYFVLRPPQELHPALPRVWPLGASGHSERRVGHRTAPQSKGAYGLDFATITEAVHSRTFEGCTAVTAADRFQPAGGRQSVQQGHPVLQAACHRGRRADLTPGRQVLSRVIIVAACGTRDGRTSVAFVASGLALLPSPSPARRSTQIACPAAYLIKDDVRDGRAGRWGTTLIRSNDRTSVVVNTSVPPSSAIVRPATTWSTYRCS